MPEPFEVTAARKIDGLDKSIAEMSRMEHANNLGSLIGEYLALPGLRCFWPMGSVDENGVLYDLSGQGRTLSQTGNPVSGLLNNRIPYYTYNGSSQYHTRTDEAGLSITGALTLGAWIRIDALPAVTAKIFVKMAAAAADSCYGLDLYVVGGVPQIRMFVDNGSTAYPATSTITLSLNTWYFILGTYNPSTEVGLWVNNNHTENITSIPASINDTATGLFIGVRDGPNYYFTGGVALPFICAALLADDHIKRLYRLGRVFFGV